MPRIRYSGFEYSCRSGMDGILHISLGAVNANWNSDGWNVNANSVDNPNKWNDGNQVLSCDYFLSSVLVAEVFVSRPLRQPPIIFPIISISLPSERNLLLEIRLVSHIICTKKRRESVLLKQSSSIPIFCAEPVYVAFLSSSKRSRSKLSIFNPMPNLSVRGMLR